MSLLEKRMGAAADFLMERSRTLCLTAVLLLVVAAVVLRFQYIEIRSLWYDEALAVQLSRGSFMEVLKNTRELNSSPILYPAVLWLVEKVSDRPLWVRFPAFAASVLAVILVVAYLYRRNSPTAALFSGFLIAFSPQQIRYAQEVREYALSTLLAVGMVFGLSWWSDKKAGGLWLLAIFAFISPLIQYGLVFLIVGVTLAMVTVAASGERLRWFRDVLIVGLSFVCGGILAFFLTLRFQWIAGGRAANYLENWYYDRSLGTMLSFLVTNSISLLDFAYSTEVFTGIILLSITIYLSRRRILVGWDPVIILAAYVCVTNAAAAIVRIYPYGPIRQCLYLTPVLIMAAGVAVDEIVSAGREVSGQILRTWLALLAVMLLLTGYNLNLNLSSAYAEVEDIKLLLDRLDKNMSKDDLVYIYNGAVPAFDYYRRQSRDNYIRGHYSQTDMKDLIENDLLPLERRRAKRLWLMFTGRPSNEQDVLSNLPKSWIPQMIAKGNNAGLYLIVFQQTPLS